MQLQQDIGDVRYVLRGISEDGVLVNDQTLSRSFILAPQELIEEWRVQSAESFAPNDLNPIFALNPSVILIGTGVTQIFPAPAVMAAALTRGIGIEIMNNAAAARTFNVLAAEGRKVVAGFVVKS
jgi:uncharacterized protein